MKLIKKLFDGICLIAFLMIPAAMIFVLADTGMSKKEKVYILVGILIANGILAAVSMIGDGINEIKIWLERRRTYKKLDGKK